MKTLNTLYIYFETSSIHLWTSVSVNKKIIHTYPCAYESCEIYSCEICNSFCDFAIVELDKLSFVQFDMTHKGAVANILTWYRWMYDVLHNV